MRHLDLLQRFPLKTIGWNNWVQKLLEVVKIPNKPNQNQKSEECATIRFKCSGNRQTCLVWLRKHQRKHGETCEELCASVCWTFRSRRKRWRRSDKNGETRWKWTIHRFVHTARGNRHWLQSVWIATCSCETSRKLPCSRTREEDRESFTSRSTSSRFATK